MYMLLNELCMKCIRYYMYIYELHITRLIKETNAIDACSTLHLHVYLITIILICMNKCIRVIHIVLLFISLIQRFLSCNHYETNLFY